MKFVADVMLGKLARRLRLLGYDVIYERNSGDNEIIRISLEQHRLILTRDGSLVQRPLARHHLFIASENIKEQVEQIVARFPPEPDSAPLSRCSACNVLLTPLDKISARDLVPQHIYEAKKIFLQCFTCRRVYWEGSHVKNMGLRETVKFRTGKKGK